MGSRSTFALAFGFALLAGCAPRPRMCTATSECTGPEGQVACVAGRCQPDRPNVKPAIDSARRLIVRPVDVAYLRRGDAPSEGALPPLFALGRDASVLLLRFSVSLQPTTNIVEAYVMLRRSDAVDDDPAPISLHAARVVERWSGRSTSWAFQPRTAEVRTPSTVVEPGGPALVRLDVRELVRHWGRRDPSDQGIAVVAENESRTGATFAFRAVGTDGTPAEPVFSGAPQGAFRGSEARSSSAPDVEPYLELYVR